MKNINFKDFLIKHKAPIPVSYKLAIGKSLEKIIHGIEYTILVFSDNTCLCLHSFYDGADNGIFNDELDSIENIKEETFLQDIRYEYRGIIEDYWALNKEEVEKEEYKTYLYLKNKFEKRR